MVKKFRERRQLYLTKSHVETLLCALAFSEANHSRSDATNPFSLNHSMTKERIHEMYNLMRQLFNSEWPHEYQEYNGQTGFHWEHFPPELTYNGKFNA